MEEKLCNLLQIKEQLKQINTQQNLEISKLKKAIEKMKDEKFSEHLALMRERDARYTLFFENMQLQQLKHTGNVYVDDVYGDPVVLRISLDRCREQLTLTQKDLSKLRDEYADTVPRRDYDELETKYSTIKKDFTDLSEEFKVLKEKQKKLSVSKANTEEELRDSRERCSELELTGTPRPRWEMCADYIGGGKDRWRQLSFGLSSRDSLKVLLKELGPAAESDHLEHFDGLGTDPSIPPYLRYEGKVRNLRLSRREISVLITDVWCGKLKSDRTATMQDYLTRYFEERYQQPAVRAEWAYNLCASAEQMLDDAQVKLFWGVLHGHLCQNIYIRLWEQWNSLKDTCFKLSKDNEKITIDELEKVLKTIFPLKSEVDIKNLTDVVKKQLKIKINSNDVNLDKLFYENEEGFDRGELARELYRQRQIAQDKYIREIITELGGKHHYNKAVTLDALKRAFAIVDPAIDHICMDRYTRWVFPITTQPTANIFTIPLRSVLTRLAAGDIERIGPRQQRASFKRNPLKTII